MAITKDSGVRTTFAVDLSKLSDEEIRLVRERQEAIEAGTRLGGATVQRGGAHGHDEPHVVPLWVLFGTFALLMILTVATVAARQVDLGQLNIIVALGLAFIKATLVGLFFMHLFWDNRFNLMALLASLFFLTIFITAACVDSGQYRPNLTPPGGYAGDVVSQNN